MVTGDGWSRADRLIFAAVWAFAAGYEAAFVMIYGWTGRNVIGAYLLTMFLLQVLVMSWIVRWKVVVARSPVSGRPRVMIMRRVRTGANRALDGDRRP